MMWRPFLRGLMWFWLPLTAILVWEALNKPDTNWFAVAGTVVAFGPAFVGAIIIHELGHAAVAWTLRFKIPRIDVGVGQSIAHLPIGKTEVHIRALPFSGFTYVSPRTKLLARTRLFIMCLGGPLANILVAGLVLNTRPDDWDTAITYGWLDLLAIWYWANAGIGLFNLIPFKFGGLQSDGLQLVTVWFRRGKTVQRWVSSKYNLYAWNAHARGDFDTATVVLQRGLEQFPEDMQLHNDLAVMALERGQLDVAGAVFQRLLDDPETEKKQIPLLKNNLAWVGVMSPEEDGLPRAHQLASEAAKSHPEDVTFKGTLGAVLVRMNQPRQALPLLKKALERTSDDRSRAHQAAWLSAAYAKLGDTTRAQQYRQTARRIHPECASLPVVERLLSSTTQQTTPQG